jgi:hypothetical protein
LGLEALVEFVEGRSECFAVVVECVEGDHQASFALGGQSEERDASVVG